jgi:hypothetical protein
VQIVDERLCPNPKPAEKSARIEGHCRPGCSLGHRRHFSSPVGSHAARRCRRRQRCEPAAAPLGLIACTLLSAISGLIGSK